MVPDISDTSRYPRSGKTWDLVIVGSGIAGLAAARLAFDRGLDFCVVADGFGATQHWSGACDLIDPRWRNPGLRADDFVGWEKELVLFAHAHPGHPYANLIFESPDFLSTIIPDMRGFLKFYGIPFTGDGKNPVIVLGSTGRPKFCPFAMSSLGIGAEDMGGRRGAVCVDFPGLTDYPVTLIAKELEALFGSVRVVGIDSLRVNNLSPLASLAELFDRDDTAVGKMIDAVGNHNNQPGVVVIPPVLGVARWRENFEKSQSRLGARVVEMLSGLPSVTGLRFKAIVESALIRHGIKRFVGCVSGFDADGARLSALKIQQTSHDDVGADTRLGTLPEPSAKRQAQGDCILRAHQFIFAGGKYLGGGLKHRGAFKEPLFNLQLYDGVRKLGRESHITHHIATDSVKSQGFMRVGVIVDARGRPTRDGIPVFENLRVCGHILGGFDFTRERCGFGLSVVSARRAVG